MEKGKLAVILRRATESYPVTNMSNEFSCAFFNRMKIFLVFEIKEAEFLSTCAGQFHITLTQTKAI